MTSAVEFAKRFTAIISTETEIIIKAKHTLLFHDNTPWKKANTGDLFDVTMSCYDGAETGELVGTYILNEISSIVPKGNIGVYRDDGLAVVHKSPSETKNIKKKLLKNSRTSD